MGDDKFIKSQYMKENVMSKVIDKLGEEMVDTIMTAYYDAIKEITVTDSDWKTTPKYKDFMDC